MHVVVAEECYHPHYRQLTPAEMSISMDNIIHTTVRLITNNKYSSSVNLVAQNTASCAWFVFSRRWRSPVYLPCVPARPTKRRCLTCRCTQGAINCESPTISQSLEVGTLCYFTLPYLTGPCPILPYFTCPGTALPALTPQ